MTVIGVLPSPPSRSPDEADVRALLNEAYPEGAPDELGLYYGKHGPPDATVLLRLAQRIVGHLSIYESRIKVGSDEVMAGLVGEVAVAVDQRGWGHVRALMGRAHQHLRERSIPFSILFAFEPPVYMSSGYRSMTNEMLFLDKDRTWKTLVYRGGMVAELLGRPWPDGPVDLCGETVQREARMSPRLSAAARMSAATSGFIAACRVTPDIAALIRAAKLSSLRAKRRNPEPSARLWIASSLRSSQ